MTETDFVSVTELDGDEVSQDQIDRIVHRYQWAATYCHSKDVVELACGPGIGLSVLSGVARSLRAGDVSPAIVRRGRTHYGDRVRIDEMDAQDTGLPAAAFDVVILFEAIYYLADVDRFLEEVRRVLRPDGVLLLCTANPDLPDFNPSPYSHRYLGVRECDEALRRHGFEPSFLGASPRPSGSVLASAVSLAKRVAVKLHLVPKTMEGKKWLKALIYGRLVPMPNEITGHEREFEPPLAISSSEANLTYRVLYCAARKL